MNTQVKIAKTNKRAFTNWTKFLGWTFENTLYQLTEQFLGDQYRGGLWEAGYIGEANRSSYFPIPPHTEGQMFDVTNTGNYFEGKMTPRAFGVSLMLIALSTKSFDGGVSGQNASNMYHALRELMFDSIESDDPKSLTTDEGQSIIQFID